MRWVNYPLSVFVDAIGTSIGWAFFILATTILSSWIGIWIGSGHLPDVSDAFGAVGAIALTSFVNPPSALCVGVTFLAWYLGDYFESFTVYITTAAVNSLTWLAVIAVFTHSLYTKS